MKQISKALVMAQSEMSNPVKDSINPFFKSKYADLNAVREAVIPVLNRHGIVVLQPIVHQDGKNFVQTVLLHESGEQIESLTEIVYSKQNDAQAQGSGISYARRYGLQSFVCVGADDDDAESAKAAVKQSAQPNIDPALEAAIKEMESVTDIEALKKLWRKYPNFQDDAKFVSVKDKRKAELDGSK